MMPQLGEAYRYQPQGMTGHPAYGVHVTVVGLILDTATGAKKIRVHGPDGVYEPTADIFARDYWGPLA
jgi:hypothetical protein